MHNERLHRIAKTRLPLVPSVEAVEKVPKHIHAWGQKKNDLIEYATINDLMLGRG